MLADVDEPVHLVANQVEELRAADWYEHVVDDPLFKITSMLGASNLEASEGYLVSLGLALIALRLSVMRDWRTKDVSLQALG